MRLIGNLLWLVFGGLWMALGWLLAGAICFLSIIGIPWGRACFVIGQLAFLPFGNEAVDRRVVTQREDIGTGIPGVVGNVLWFIVAGWWLALGHLFHALLCCITIIGIPFGLQHLKLAGLALAPIGKTVVPLDRTLAR
ncbi:YccF domain-containing protein [Niveibacterium sp. COAC-50]|uniref:YccF domain-containing protein n=1 Tax=Niveibacterium sp. COAC-50 TaxID=2729384 RepID=UPI001551D070|nr:YccF domain-containing protein [Niveibacterium sp. COAC-50]